MFKLGDQIALVANSNGLNPSQQLEIEALIQVLNNWGLTVKVSPYLYANPEQVSVSAKKRADILMTYMKDSSIQGIFDVSGGDVANEVLPYLDMSVIKQAKTPFFGYSDVTTLLNAIYKETGVPTYLYQLRHLVSKTGDTQPQKWVNETFFNEQPSLFQVDWQWLRGSQMTGLVVGGNIRCLLKLAGTPYFPQMTDSLLFLEAMSGDEAKIRTYFAQLHQLGVFQEVKGVLLGTFTQLDQTMSFTNSTDLLLELIATPSLPIVRTKQIGHSPKSKGLIIGKEWQLTREENGQIV